MDLSQMNFAHPSWLWGNLILFLVWMIYVFFYRVDRPMHQLEKFIDSHLLPYLLINKSSQKSSVWKTLLLWSAIWVCLTFALAGPRWSFREIETFSRDQSLVILLDLSESMNATDIKPSRLVRAKQKIEDLINLSKGVKIGLIAFAADPHMISPVTEDKEMIRHLLPSLGTDLIYVQGSRLSVALDMAASMLEAEPGTNKAILVLSDGGFEDSSALITVKTLSEKGLAIHAMGVGLVEGVPLKDHHGNVIKKNGVPIFSKLEKEKLKGISEAGNGRYLEAQYSDNDEIVILKDLEKRAEAQLNISKKSRLWDERFYLLLIPALPVLLWWFRRGYILSALLIFFVPGMTLEASTVQEYFKNSEEQGKQLLDELDYETAVDKFKDPYRKGVAYYKAGHFAEAEKMFSKSARPEVASSAAYNLGNALVQQKKFKEAVAAYENVLKKWPDHSKAKDNLELVKSILEEQQQGGDSDSGDSDDTKEEGDQQKKDSSKSESSEEKEGENEKQEPNESDESNEINEKSQDSQSENVDSEDKQQEGEELQNKEDEVQEPQEEDPKARPIKSQEDQDADLWLNQISNDPKTFLKNKFYLESKKNGTIKGTDPW